MNQDHTSLTFQDQDHDWESSYSKAEAIFFSGARCFDHTERMWEERSCSQVKNLLLSFVFLPRQQWQRWWRWRPGAAVATLGKRLLQLHLPRAEAAHAGGADGQHGALSFLWYKAALRCALLKLSPLIINLKVLNHTFTCFYPGQEIEVTISSLKVNKNCQKKPKILQDSFCYFLFYSWIFSVNRRGTTY